MQISPNFLYLLSRLIKQLQQQIKPMTIVPHLFKTATHLTVPHEKNQYSPRLCCISSLILINIVWALRKLCVLFRTKTHKHQSLEHKKIDCKTKTWVSYDNSNRPSIFILFCLILYVFTSSSSLLFRIPTIKGIFDIHHLIYQECIGKFTRKQHTCQVYP